MTARTDKLSALIVAAAVFFFSAASAQAAIDTSLDLWYQVNVAKYDQGGNPFVVDYTGDGVSDPIYANPWGLRVGDYFPVTVAWDSSAPKDDFGAYAYGNWTFAATLGTETINGVAGSSNLLYVTPQGNVDYYSMDIRYLSAHQLSLLADSDVLIVDDWYYAGTGQFALSALRAAGPPAAPVPLPSAVWLFGSGLVGMVGLRRKFRK